MRNSDDPPPEANESPTPAQNTPDEGPTEQLIRKAKEGDEAALNALFATHYDELRRFVRKRIGPALRRQVDDSEDILHSAMRGALISLPDFEPRGQEAWVRWMGTIIVNKISSKARHHRAAKRGGGRPDMGGTAGLEWIGQAETDETSPSAAAVAREEQDWLYDALDTLPAERRDLLVKSHISKMPLSEMAKELDITEEAVRQRLLRAEKALKVAINKLKQDRR